MSRQTVRALARSKEVFYASVAGELFSGLFMGPIRGQMTRCILPTEIGKVAPVPLFPRASPVCRCSRCSPASSAPSPSSAA